MALGDALAQARALVATLEQLASDAGANAATSTTDENATSEHDNAQPFKCPDCGKTFDTQAVCDNQHPPVATLPTAQVLDGAVAGDNAESVKLAAVDVPADTVEKDESLEPGASVEPAWPGGTA